MRTDAARAGPGPSSRTHSARAHPPPPPLATLPLLPLPTYTLSSLLLRAIPLHTPFQPPARSTARLFPVRKDAMKWGAKLAFPISVSSFWYPAEARAPEVSSMNSCPTRLGLSRDADRRCKAGRNTQSSLCRGATRQGRSRSPSPFLQKRSLMSPLPCSSPGPPRISGFAEDEIFFNTNQWTLWQPCL